MLLLKGSWSLGICLLLSLSSAKISLRKFSSTRISRKAMGLNEFMTEAKKLSNNYKSSARNIDIVLGNESCDLDSVVSAILFAYYLSSPQTDDHEGVAIPILNIPASHLNIKTEVVYFLKENNVSLDSLVFRDSMDLELLAAKSRLSVRLVDHHVLAARDQFLSSYVREVIDHRPVLDSWPQLEHKTLDIVGSCVTHVAKKMLTSCPELIQNDVHVANLIYGTILLDTACLSPQANRATPADHDIISQLKAVHGQNLQPEKQLFESLLAAKSDVSSLSSADLLIKDLKFSKHGVPIVGLPILVQEFLTRTADVKSTLNKFLTENRASLLILMGQEIRHGVITRDLGLYSTSPDAEEKANRILDLLRSNENPPLHLEQKQDGIVRVFSVGNVQVSRKQVLPLVEKALEK